MSYEITTVTRNGADVSRDYIFVPGRQKEAKYAFSAPRAHIVEHVPPRYSGPIKDVSVYKPKIDKYADDVIDGVPQKKAPSFWSKLQNLFSRKSALDDEALLGVDITPSCIYVCQIDSKGGNTALTGLASVCVEGKFVNEDILNNPNLYSESLKKLIAEHKITSKKVAVSLPVSSSIVRMATISKMCDADIARAIKYGSLWQNLMGKGDSPDNYSIFYQVIRREKTSDTMDILLVATRLADINLYKNIITNSGLAPVIVDAKSMALHYALKNRPNKDARYGTVLIEFGLENNYIMVMGGAAPRVFEIAVSDAERAAILGFKANGNDEIMNQLVARFAQRLRTIISSYRVIKPFIAIEDIYISSSSPLIGSFVQKLKASVTECRVTECSMFDYLKVPDNFTITKKSAENNISTWAGAISMAMMPWKNHREEWIEIRKSPAYGTQFVRHFNKIVKNTELSIKMGEFDPYEKVYEENTSTLARLVSAPNILAVGAAMLIFMMISDSYSRLAEEGARLDAVNSGMSYIVDTYRQKELEVKSMQDVMDEMEGLEIKASEIKETSNQKYVLSIYNYLDDVLQNGVWLKQLNYTAPTGLEVEGRAMEDEDVVGFLDGLKESHAFTNVALKHMQSMSELDMFSNQSVSIKSFIINGNLADNLPKITTKKVQKVDLDETYGAVN